MVLFNRFTTCKRFCLLETAGGARIPFLGHVDGIDLHVADLGAGRRVEMGLFCRGRHVNAVDGRGCGGVRYAESEW